MRFLWIVCFFVAMIWPQKTNNETGIEKISIIQYPVEFLKGIHKQEFILPQKNIFCIFTAKIVAAEEPFLQVVLTAGKVSSTNFQNFLVVEIREKRFYERQEYEIKKYKGEKKIIKECKRAPYQPSTELLGEGWKVMRSIRGV